MSLWKDIKKIKEDVAQISDKTLKKANELDKTKDLLNDVKLSAKPKVMFDVPTHNFKVRIDFEIPPVELLLDDNNEESESPLLRALNLLGLIKIGDAMEIAKSLEEAKERNGNNGIRRKN